MKPIAQTLSFLALAATILPAFLFFFDRLSLSASQICMLGGAVGWFATAPLWMEHKAND